MREKKQKLEDRRKRLKKGKENLMKENILMRVKVMILKS